MDRCRFFLSPVKSTLESYFEQIFFLIFALATELIMYSYFKFSHLNLSKNFLEYDTDNPFPLHDQHSQLEFALGN